MVLSWDKVVTLNGLVRERGSVCFSVKISSATVKAGNWGVYVPDMPRAATVPGLSELGKALAGASS